MIKVKLDLDTDESNKLNTNNAYAKKYENWRRLEEIEKLKSQVGDDETSGSSSDSSEGSAEWTLSHEREFLHTLAALKTKDPKIYSSEQMFNTEFVSSNSTTDNLKKKKRKKKRDMPLLLKDYERKLILEKGGVVEEDDDNKIRKIKDDPGYYKKQELLKNELKLALEKDDSSDELLKKKEKSVGEIKKEEDDYYDWLKGQSNENNAKFERLKGLKAIWRNDKNLDSEEKFLRDFLLEKKYEVDEDKRLPFCPDFMTVSEDEKEIEREREFEERYNFRFEDSEKDFIKQYPRRIVESVRKTEDKRKEKRATYKERKLAEKQAKKEEIRELKALKKKEIEAKLEKLKKLAGEEISINFNDIEGDFDPVAHDKRMEELFNKAYYEKGCEDEEKPCFSELSDASDELEAYEYESALNSPNFQNMLSCKDGEKTYREKLPTARKRKRNSRFWNAITKEKPLFNPEEKTFEEYFNEYYALDYEDIIGDTITRFKYRNVPANNFGLTGEEILNADDGQLNAWASLKKVTGYRTEQEEKYDVIAYAKKAKDVKKKERILSAGCNSEWMKKINNQVKNPESSRIEKKRSLEKQPQQEKESAEEKKEIKIVLGDVKEYQEEDLAQNNKNTIKKTRRKRKIKKAKSFEEDIGIDDKRLKAYGLNPKKFRNKLKWLKRLNKEK